MNWKTLTSIVRDRDTEILVNVLPNTDYSISNNGLHVAVEDMAGNILLNGEGTYNSGTNEIIVVKVQQTDEIMMNKGPTIRPFEPMIPLEERKNAVLQVNVPIDKISGTGLTYAQFGGVIRSVAVSGIKVQTMYEGSFSFSDDYETPQMDNKKGFADDAQTIGGTLGYFYDTEYETNLPI